MLSVDFVIRTDGLGLRYTYPVSPRGRDFFEANIGEFDLSEQGWELDTMEDDLDTFMTFVHSAGLSVAEMCEDN